MLWMGIRSTISIQNLCLIESSSSSVGENSSSLLFWSLFLFIFLFSFDWIILSHMNLRTGCSVSTGFPGCSSVPTQFSPCLLTLGTPSLKHNCQQTSISSWFSWTFLYFQNFGKLTIKPEQQAEVYLPMAVHQTWVSSFGSTVNKYSLLKSCLMKFKPLMAGKTKKPTFDAIIQRYLRQLKVWDVRKCLELWFSPFATSLY